MIIESIREGFNLANKNLPLVLVRVAATIIYLVSFFVFLAIPVVIAVTYMGFDLAQAGDMLPSFRVNPFEFVSRYLGLIFLVASAFLLYLTFASVLFLYVLGGTLGVLRNSAVNIQYRFSLSSFFREAGSNFWPLFWLVSIIFLAFTVILIVFVVSGGIIAAVVQSMTGGEGTLGVFFNSFVMMTLIIFSIILLLGCCIFSVYSVVVSVIDGKGSMESIKRTSDFLKKKPGALFFYFILLAGIIAINIVFLVLRVPFSMVPVLAPVMHIVLTLFSSIFQSYLAVVLWSCLIAYYLRGTDYPVYSAAYEI